MVSNNDWCLLKSVSGGSVLLAQVSEASDAKYIGNGVVEVDQFYDLSRIVIALSTKKLPMSPVKVTRNSYISFAYIAKVVIDCNHCINVSKEIERLKRELDKGDTKDQIETKKKFKDFAQKEQNEILKDKLTALIQPIEYL